MSNKYQDELYEKLNAAFNHGGGKENSRKDILKLVPGNNYVVRLIPNMEDIEKTFMRYYMHGWVSAETGRYISTGCPTTFEEECPVCSEYFKLYNKGTDESRALASNVKRKTRLYANVFVVDDPTTPENNNTVKILSYGQQLETVIEDGWSGDDKDDVGVRMFDFSENGCNLRIKVEKNQGGFPTYTSSKFLNPSPVSVTLEEILDQTHDIVSLVKVKPKDELLKMIATGLYGENVDATSTSPSTPAPTPVAESAPTPTTPTGSVAGDDKGGDDDVLSGLDEFLEKNS